MAQKNMSYKNAIAEIQEILDKIESEEIDIETLSEKVKRATELIAYCKDKLIKIDSDVENILKDID
jgi:exodeoxyribonuclease VII small subunit